MISIILSTIALVVVATLLILLTLLQTPKDEGQSPVGGTGLENLVGVAQTSTFLEKITYFLATLLIALVLLTSYLIKEQYTTQKTHVATEYLEQYETKVNPKEQKSNSQQKKKKKTN